MVHVLWQQEVELAMVHVLWQQEVELAMVQFCGSRK